MDALISDKEREVVAEIASRAMISGWENSILRASQQYGISTNDIKILLDKAERSNQHEDPSARISELDDWAKERRGRSRQSGGGKLHLLSPGLRAYMEAKTRRYSGN